MSSSVHKSKTCGILTFKMPKIVDKEVVSIERFCPPHYLPHKFPFGKKIADEPCHIHKEMYNIIHHKFFCNYLKCANYDFMTKKLEEQKNV